MTQREIKAEQGTVLLFGANKVEGGYNFVVEAPEGNEVSLVLYRKRAKTPAREIPLGEKYRTGRMYTVKLPDFPAKEYEYNFRINGKITQDSCAYAIYGREKFGEPANADEHKVRCGFLTEEAYDWEEDAAPGIHYHDMILYKLHVRGCTKQWKCDPKKRGTFSGLTEMIPYLKELGINAVELMPAYEFMEVPPVFEKQSFITERRSEGRVNYWGYVPGYYFAPKASYCATKEPQKEFRDMVKALHKAGIACIMEFFFPGQVQPLQALSALLFWKRFYHVDGFHLLGEGVPLDLVLKDGFLSDTKLFVPGYNFGSLSQGKTCEGKNLAEYNPGFLQDMRRFLKSDEDTVGAAQFRIRNNSGTHAVVNYMVCQDGFTLNDLVSYDYKHNEDNGEDNQDGTSYNFSWNCGVEGPSRKQAVRQIRERQMRNAFLMMLLSQGVPMLYAGDEAANSQNGNNNAYCQDNAVGWVDWKGLKKNAGLHDFVRDVIAFRKAHPILHMPQELKESDYLAKGFPDISFHGERAWYCSHENTSRLLGVMYCGAYATKENGEPDDFIYVAYNFHWEERKIALPNLPEGMAWKKVIDTGESASDAAFAGGEEEYIKNIEIGPRTIIVLLGR